MICNDDINRHTQSPLRTQHNIVQLATWGKGDTDAGKSLPCGAWKWWKASNREHRKPTYRNSKDISCPKAMKTAKRMAIM